MSFILSILLTTAQAYEVGNAPFCVMDDYGNTKCFYYTLSACREAVKLEVGSATCVKR